MNLEEMKINLRTLWTIDYNQCPDWVDDWSVIYKIKNLINGKIYIGRASYFYNRLAGVNCWGHLGSFIEYCKYNGRSRYLYNAIRKYHSRNFEVSIIDHAETESELEDLEQYYIKLFNSFGINGYNMTPGGEDYLYIHTPEMEAQRLKTNKENHGGILAWHLPESRKAAYDTIAKRYNGDCMGQCHTPEVYQMIMNNHGGVMSFHTPEARAKADKSRAAKYSGDPQGQIHTKESMDKRLKLMASRYNGDSAGQMHTPEARRKSQEKSCATKALYYNGDPYGPIHTTSSYIKSNCTRIITTINKWIDEIRVNHPELDDLTFDLYWNYRPWDSSGSYRKVRAVLSWINELRADSRWTPEMENIFSYLESHRSEYKI